MHHMQIVLLRVDSQCLLKEMEEFLLLYGDQKGQRVTKLPLASETMALAEAVDAGYLVAANMQNMSDLRTRVDMAGIQEVVELKEINIMWVEGKQQLADGLTKCGVPAALLVKVRGSGLRQ